MGIASSRLMQFQPPPNPRQFWGAKTRKTELTPQQRLGKTNRCILGVGLGLLSRRDSAGGKSCRAFRSIPGLEYIHLAAQTLLRLGRIHGVRLRMSACLNHSIDVMGSESRHCIFVGRVSHASYRSKAPTARLLAGMWAHTRRSLAMGRRSRRNADRCRTSC